MIDNESGDDENDELTGAKTELKKIKNEQEKPPKIVR